MRLHLDPHFGRKRIAEIKRAEVQDFIRAKTATLSAGYVRLNLVATLRAILQPYVAGDRLPRNAASGSPTFQYPPLSKAPKKLHGSITTKKSSDGRTLVDGGRALTRDEVALLLTHSSPQYWTVLLTMVYTGMRLGEVLAMQWEYLTEGYTQSDCIPLSMTLIDAVNYAMSRQDPPGQRSPSLRSSSRHCANKGQRSRRRN